MFQRPSFDLPLKVLPFSFHLRIAASAVAVAKLHRET